MDDGKCMQPLFENFRFAIDRCRKEVATTSIGMGYVHWRRVPGEVSIVLYATKVEGGKAIFAIII
jgi:hypothetical protein